METETLKKYFFRFFYGVKKFFYDNAVLIFVLFFLFIVKFQFLFLSYLDFRYEKYRDVEARVVNQYVKHSKRGSYYVLKLKNKEHTFYTTSREDLKNLLNERLRLTLITSHISFKDYLFGFYAPSFNIRLLPVSFLDEYIEKQHDVKKVGDVFKALFLGESVDYETRQQLSTLGVSHLIALSGLHLGFISLFLYVFLTPFYLLFQKKFPYRNRYVDLAAVIFAIEFAYLYITSFPPSLIRAYVLEIIVFLYAYYLQNPFSLKVLAVVFAVSLFLFGVKVFLLGYFLSMAGVFYIYLFFRYYKPGLASSFMLSFYMYGVMFVISHSFFGNFNIYQLLSPFTNIFFTLFYPFEIIMHIMGFGDVLDVFILKYLSLGNSYYDVSFPLWGMFLFLGLSVVAFFSKRAFYGINLISITAVAYAIGVGFV